MRIPSLHRKSRAVVAGAALVLVGIASPVHASFFFYHLIPPPNNVSPTREVDPSPPPPCTCPPPPTQSPEPGTLALATLGIGGLTAYRKMRKTPVK